MKIALIILIIVMNSVCSNSQDFVTSYKSFWASRISKEQRNNNLINSEKINKIINIQVINSDKIKERYYRIESLKTLLKNYYDSTSINFQQSPIIYILIFYDSRTDLERTFFWTSNIKIYYEEILVSDSTKISSRKVVNKPFSSAVKLQNSNFTTKEDTLITLLDEEKLSIMNKLAQTHKIEGGESCIGIVCVKNSVGYVFKYVDLPPFEFIKQNRK